MTNAKIIIISGPSGVGKDTIIKGVLKRIPNLLVIKSYTTRAKRKSDEVGNRHFISHNEFEKLIAANKMIEYKEYCGNLYGRKKEDIIAPLEAGKNIIMEVEVQGTLNYQKLFGKRVISIFIKYENPQEFLSRIKKNRPETSAKELEIRQQSLKNEMAYEKYYNYSLINSHGHPEKAIEQVTKIILKNLNIIQ